MGRMIQTTSAAILLLLLGTPGGERGPLAHASQPGDAADERLEELVRSALGESGLGDAVRVRVQSRVVYLSGPVDDARGKVRAIQAAFSISEVESVESELGILRGVTPELEEAIWLALFSERLEDFVSEVLVRDGAATLRGEVPDRETRERVLRVVKSVPGIASVTGDLAVAAAPAEPSPPPTVSPSSESERVKPTLEEPVRDALDPAPPDPVEREPVAEPERAAEPEPAAGPEPVAEPERAAPEPTVATAGTPPRLESPTPAPTIQARDIAVAILTSPGYSVFDYVQFSLGGVEVVLHGAVTALSKKQELESRVRAVTGIGNVKNEIRVLPDSKDDRRLRERLFRRIYEDPLFAPFAEDPNPPVHILVDGGLVTLTGVVDETIQQMSAEAITRNAFEVTVVQNRIRVRKR